jgi:pyruvate dehydrogenase E2 component (dihydrolipoamide acetyltransferase)
MTIKDITVPDIGDFDSVEVIEILVAIGDQIEAEDSLITVESDKASMEIPSNAAGIVKEIKVSIGDDIAEGGLILVIEETSSAVETANAEESVTEPESAAIITEPQQQTSPTPSIESSKVISPTKLSPTANVDEVSFSKAYASPSVRKFARELGVDLGALAGTGRKSRILREDVKEFVKAALSAGISSSPTASNNTPLGITPMPVIDFSQFGAIDTLPLTKINRLTGEFLHRSWLTVPHVTQFDEADITEMEAFRKKMGQEMEREGIKITPLAFIIQAVVASLKAFPRFNSSLDAGGDNIILKSYYNIGVAVDTPDGLVVPVIRDADSKSLVQISQEIREFAGKARDKKLKPSDMQGGCFTISSLGGIGGTKFTPIVNTPEVAILGVSRSKMQPEWNGSEFVPRLMLPLSLSYDHRVIDGADGARFTSYLGKMLSDIRRLLV